MIVAVDAMLLGGRHSGVEVAIEGLCRGLASQTSGNRFLVAHRAVYDARPLAEAGLSPVKAPVWANSRPGRILWERRHMPGLLRKLGAQLLHAPGYILPAGWNGPSLVTVYDLLTITHPEWCKISNAWHYRWALPRSVLRANLVVTPSQCVKREIVETLRVPEERVRVVALGLSPGMRPATQEQVAAARAVLGLPERFIVWVGNLEPKKNVEGLVQAFERASEKIPHSLVLVGGVGWKCNHTLARIARSPVAHRIMQTGYIPGELLPAVLTGADLLVHWSWYEGAGLPPLEAMACGTPAIVSDGGALPELAGQMAPVVPLGNPGNLADEIVALVSDRNRHDTLAARGRVWAQQFTWERHAEQVVKLYQEALAGGTPS